jgi:hypothetical protein
MIIINGNHVDQGLRVTAAACLMDNVRSYYGSTSGEIISQADKEFLKDNLIDSITLSIKIKPIRYPTLTQLDLPADSSLHC